MFESAKKMGNELAALKKQMESKGQAILRECFAEFFDAHPDVLAMQWTQYTPHFNDGDPCTFRVNGGRYCSLKIEGVAGEDGEDEAPEGFVSKYSDAAEGRESLFEAAEELFSAIPDEMFQAALGDHVDVTATRDGFDVEEYEHD